MRFILAILISALLLGMFASCSSGTEVVKPRHHKSWYKNHRWNKKWKIGRLQVRPFEKQGVKKIKMKR